jgi:dynein heavy chain, axonemal
MPLVMFADALEHVSRISRIIRQPQGNALLLGVGGSGRQSMTRLATYISGFRLFNVNITKGYGQTEWREDLKTCLLYAGIQDKPIVFLFSDAQVVMESMVEDLNNILNAGDVPNLYAAEDEDTIVQACRVECQRKRIPPTKLNIFAQYLIRVRRNLHVCFCMSPIGEAFRNRLRNFPSIVNCSTADWFTLWPKDALISVASAILDTSDMQNVLKDNLNPMVEMFGNIHLSVEQASKQFYDTLRRRNYVTPTSFLELLSSFKSLLMFKQNQVNTKRERLQVGLDKLSSTKEVVSTLQKEIEALAPVLVKKSKEVSEMMVIITKDKADAEVIKAKCEVEEASANEKAAATKEIADSAQADLDKALPALAAAVKSLDALKKSDIDEVKALGKPPNGVRLTMEVCCLMFEVKPDIIKDPETGKKVPDYFGTSKKTLLTDARGFMDQMIKYDKDNIKDSVIKKIAPFMEDPDFTPDAIKKASVACTAICMWAHAMNTYHYVALGVAPKKAKLKEAQAVLDKVLASLAEAKAKLEEVVNKVASLERQFDAAMAEKAELEAKATQCQTRLANATKLIGGLGGEEARWKDTVGHLNSALVCVPGDVAVSAGTVSYLAPFTSDYRNRITEAWRNRLKELKIKFTEGCDIEQTLADPIKLRKWQLCSLPTDSLSTQNGIIMDTARRWPLVLDPQGQANTYVNDHFRTLFFFSLSKYIFCFK